jgi:hypothetical protein
MLDPKLAIWRAQRDGDPRSWAMAIYEAEVSRKYMFAASNEVNLPPGVSSFMQKDSVALCREATEGYLRALKKVEASMTRAKL